VEAAKILIIDDEKEICELTKSFLLKKNYACFIANSAAEALVMAEKEHPQIVLLDVRLGDSSGIDVLRQIKEIDDKIKVIMVTGLGDEETIRKALSLGADDYVIKPFTAAYLYDLLTQKLAKSEVKNG